VNKLNPWAELAASAVLIMNLCWTVPWLQLFAGTGISSPSWLLYLVMGIILSVVYILGRLGRGLYLKTNIQTVLAAFLAIVGILLAILVLMPSSGADEIGAALNRNAIRGWRDATAVIPGQFLIALTVLLVWWRGLSLSRQHIGPFLVQRNFRLGIAILSVFGVLIARTSGGVQPLWVYTLFLFSGLLALGAARIAILEVFKGAEPTPFNRRWLSGVTLGILSVLGTALLIALVLMGQMDRLAGWLQDAIYFLGLVLLSPLILLASLLSMLWGRLASAAPTVPPPSITPMAEPESPYIPSGQITTLINQGSADLVEAFKFVLIWGSVFLAILLLIILVRRLLVTNLQDNEHRQDQLSAYERLGDLPALLRASLLGDARQAVEGLSKRLNRGERVMAAARIRRIYSQLLDLSKDLGALRPASKTPLEFLNVLEMVFPGLSEDLRIITDAYIRVRYGEYPETQQQVDAVEKAWLRVRAFGETHRQKLMGRHEFAQPG
jgi:hypothetical protein